MNHDTSYLHSEYARNKSIESYRIEEAQNTAKEVKGATARAGIMIPPAPEKEDETGHQKS